MEKNILLYAKVRNDKLLLATKEDFENLKTVDEKYDYLHVSHINQLLL